MPSRGKFEQSLRSHGVSDEVVAAIINVPYRRSEDKHQDDANFYCQAMRKCEELLDFGTLSRAMGDICCHRRSRITLGKNREFAEAHGGKPLAEKIRLLEHLSQPWFTDANHIASYITGEHQTACSCWVFRGRTPEDGRMPESYCLCCAGYLRFHYQKALGVRLQVEKVTSSLLHGDSRCAVVFEILR
jgi:hypothetical protein